MNTMIIGEQHIMKQKLSMWLTLGSALTID